MNIFKRFVAYLQLREAVRKADSAHEKDGGRYYVMPTTGTSKGKPKLVIMDRYNFRKLKHKGYITTKATVNDLVSECFYFTPYANGNGYITKAFQLRKVRQFFSWYDAELKAKKQNHKLAKNKD